MASIINLYNPAGVDASLLTGTGSGGLLSDGYLRGDPLATYLEPAEPAVFVLSNAKSGVTYERLDGEDRETIPPGDGYRAFALVTDSRIVFVVGDAGDDGDRCESISLTDVELVESDGGVLSNTLAVQTGDVRWTFRCRDDPAPVVEYLETASMAWMGVESHLEDARKRVVDATQHLESRSYDEALAAISDAATATDAARDREAGLCEDGVPAIDERIASLDGRAARVELRIRRGRAAHRIDVAEDRWRDEDYDAAYRAYRGAKEDYNAALAVRRPDFDASWSIREKIARVERNLESLERAPIRRADEFRERAADADDLAERASHLADALERYRTALELDWGREEPRFRGDTAEIRECIDQVASALVDARRARAGQLVKAANERYEAGDHAEAAQAYRDACEELERGLDPARELVPDAADEMAEHVAAIRARLEELASRIDEEGDRVTAEETDSSGDAGPSASTDPDRAAVDLGSAESADESEASPSVLPLGSEPAEEPDSPFEFGRVADDDSRQARPLGEQND